METKRRKTFINGKIYTADDRMPYAEAMTCEDGRILRIGRLEDLPEDKGEVTDLCGRRVIPGFVDAHMHPVLLADFRKKITVMPPDINSIEELTEAIRQRRNIQEAGQWVEGWGYDEQGFLEKRSPNRYDLDAGCSDAPVSLMRNCAHIRCVNSMALKLAGIDRNTPDPPGGEIERDEEGEPTGILKENASSLMAPYIPLESTDQKTKNLLELGELLSSQGITAICDMGNLDSSDNFSIYEKAVEEGFHQKVGIYYMWSFLWQDLDFQIPPQLLNRNRQVFAAGLKLIGDGSISGRTAWLSSPYQGSGDEYGISVCPEDLLESAVEFCKKNRCQLSMHAMGGRAIDRMIERAVREEKWTDGPVPYVRIEHVTEPSEESMELAAAHGISFVTQPIFPYAESASYLANLGKERLKTCYPVKKILEKGVTLGFSTDAPATFWSVPSDPFPGLKLAVTRRAADGSDCGKENGIDIETAVKLYTIGAARAAGFPDIGMLAEGYHADFAVLDRDILLVEPSQIDQVRVEETYVDGRCIYRIRQNEKN